MADLSFPPPYSEHAKYLNLADKFLTDGGERIVDANTVESIESSQDFSSLQGSDEKAA